MVSCCLFSLCCVGIVKSALQINLNSLCVVLCMLYLYTNIHKKNKCLCIKNTHLFMWNHLQMIIKLITSSFNKTFSIVEACIQKNQQEASLKLGVMCVHFPHKMFTV